MRFLMLSCLFCVLFTTQVFSQQLKVHGGINITNITDVPSGEANGQAGFQIGVSALFGEKFYVEPGIYYLRRYTEIVFNDNASSSTDFKVRGLLVPVSLGYYLIGKDDGPLPLRVFGGPSVFFINDTENVDKADLNSPQWNVFAGAGVDFLFLFLEMKYEWSLSDLGNSSDSERFNTFYLNAGIKFPL